LSLQGQIIKRDNGILSQPHDIPGEEPHVDQTIRAGPQIVVLFDLGSDLSRNPLLLQGRTKMGNPFHVCDDGRFFHHKRCLKLQLFLAPQDENCHENCDQNN
jgi:hypothetical protein